MAAHCKGKIQVCQVMPVDAMDISDKKVQTLWDQQATQQILIVDASGRKYQLRDLRQTDD